MTATSGAPGGETGPSSAASDEQQLVLFQLACEDYGVDIYSVQRLIEVPEITRVPRAPQFVAGVIDVRGEVIPVINLKQRFGFEQTEVNDDGRIVIVEIGEQIVGFLVDGVSEVTRVAGGDIESPSEIVSTSQTGFICGIGKQRKDGRNRLIIVLDAEQVLTEEERSAVGELSHSVQETAEQADEHALQAA